MKCAKCREELLPEAVACPNCGQPVRAAYKPPPTSRPVPIGTKPPAPKPPAPKPATPKPVQRPPTPTPPPPRTNRFAKPQSGAIPNYLVPALVSLCCCTPLGIIAVVHAAQVNTKLTMNDPAGAQLASQRAKFWCIAAYVIGVITQGIWFITNGTFSFTR